MQRQAAVVGSWQAEPCLAVMESLVLHAPEGPLPPASLQIKAPDVCEVLCSCLPSRCLSPPSLAPLLNCEPGEAVCLRVLMYILQTEALSLHLLKTLHNVTQLWRQCKDLNPSP